MANDIQLVQQQSYLPSGTEMQVIMSLCGELGKTPYYQKLGVGGCLAVMLSAREMGIPTMYALNGGLVPVNGRVTMSAQLMNAVIIRAGHQTRILHLDDTYCEIEFKRHDRNYVELYRYSIDDAKAAGLLGKDNWKHYRRDMLYCRCLSSGARKFMPDAIFGCYVHGEIEVADAIEIKPEVPTSVHELKALTHDKEPTDIESSIDVIALEWQQSFDSVDKWINDMVETTRNTKSAILLRVESNKDKAKENFEIWHQRQQNALDLEKQE